ncbi:MAG TPA: cytochrome c biogenesis protein CcsA [Planctomycetota bacterium]|nr:cytochrome c biogenesis protein CcsA [Planctomycetota bacterium]
MKPEHLAYAALISFALGAAAAIAGFRVEAFKNIGWQIFFTGLGALLKTAAIGMSCKSSESHFFNSGSEIYGLLAWALALSHLLAMLVCRVRSAGALAMPLMVLLMALSLFSGTNQPPLNRPADSLFASHILSAFLGYGLFLTACGASVLYLEQARLLKRKMFGVIFQDLPSLERLERLEILCSRLGLVVFSIALATGAAMAHAANAPLWTDWKFISTLVTWIVFFTLVVGRSLRLINGRTAAKCVLAGAALVVVTLALGHPLATSAVQNSRVQGSTFDGWPTPTGWVAKRQEVNPKTYASSKVVRLGMGFLCLGHPPRWGGPRNTCCTAHDTYIAFSGRIA